MKDTAYRSMPAVGTGSRAPYPYFINLEYAVLQIKPCLIILLSELKNLVQALRYLPSLNVVW
jgi:hypothetical protein